MVLPGWLWQLLNASGEITAQWRNLITNAASLRVVKGWPDKPLVAV